MSGGTRVRAVWILSIALLLSGAMPGVGQHAQGAETLTCADDITKFCKGVQPGGGRILKCLKANEAGLSPSCRDKLDEVQKKLREFESACQSDTEKFCKGVQPGGGRILKCLKANERELSQSCADKVREARGAAQVRKQAD